MGSAFVAIRNLFRLASGRGDWRDTGRRLEELRAEYRDRCRSFRLLVKANHEALAALAELEELLRSVRPYGMPQIRAHTVRTLAAGFQMVKQLCRMAPGKYTELFESLRRIQVQVDELLTRRLPPEISDNVLPLESLGRSHIPETGSKLARLGEARRSLGLHIPAGFAITASACRRFLAHDGLQEEINRLIQTSETDDMAGLYALSSTIRTRILAAEVPPGLRRDVETELARMQSTRLEPLRLAVRSSALGEDAQGASFAGQYHSELNVAPENLFEAYKTVVASKYGAAAISYRLNRGIRDSDVDMCVGCMEMVRAAAGGVLYTRDPLDAESELVHLAAMPGLPKSIVDGSADCDRFAVSRKGRRVVLRDVVRKRRKALCDPEEGTRLVDIPEEEQLQPAISDEQALALAGLGLLLEQVFGAPQDVEWAVREDRGIVLLQCRDLHFPGEAVQGAEAEDQLDDAGENATEISIPQESELPPALLSGGVTASPGAAAGQAFAVRSDADALRFPEKAVLVAVNALPRWAPLLSRACAVVTEHGALAGHLASVAREYGVPALLSLPEALAVLEQAGEVTVDADQCAVYSGRQEALLRRVPVRNLLHGSAVQRCLARVLDKLSPLHLTDPQSPTFAPRHCSTLHDVIRFCHEKGVQEMFCIEPRSGLDKGLSRRLVAGVPLQYWVVDLEDGLAPQTGESSDARTVDIAEVRSAPMLALWEGMQAVIWRGPPAVNAGGLLAVMARSASDPGLAEGAASPYAVRNYFLVSREYCSLQARFGFHFCTVEALLGEDSEENYIIFQFKGGAADLDRRIRRARLVAAILEERGFITEIREDSLYARIEGADRARMTRLLRVVGYLVVHTRQLDMIMGDPHEAARAGAEMRRDLTGIAARAAGVPLPRPRPNSR